MELFTAEQIRGRVGKYARFVGEPLWHEVASYRVLKDFGNYRVGDILEAPVGSTVTLQSLRARLYERLPLVDPGAPLRGRAEELEQSQRPVKKFKRIRDMKTAGELKGDGTSGL